MVKTLVQDRLIENSLKYDKIGFCLATGTGKSRIALEIIHKKKFHKILLVVAERLHMDNWEQECIKWNIPYSDFTVICYASLKKYIGTEWDALILDEAHHGTSESRMKILKTLHLEQLILLSATLSEDMKSSYEAVFGKIVWNTLTLDDAINRNILPIPSIYLIKLHLNDKESVEIVKKQKKGKHKEIVCQWKDRWKYIGNPDFSEIHIKCSERQKYDYYSDLIDYWKKRYNSTGNIHCLRNQLKTGLERKRFLGELKTVYVRKLLEKIEDMRYICFCTDIKQVEALGGFNTIHSKKKDSQSVIDSFNEGRIDNIFAVNMAVEGQNLANIEGCIIIQLDSMKRSFIQKSGRSYRAENPIQFLFYYENTRDEDYLSRIFEDIDKKYINVITDIDNTEFIE